MKPIKCECKENFENRWLPSWNCNTHGWIFKAKPSIGPVGFQPLGSDNFVVKLDCQDGIKFYDEGKSLYWGPESSVPYWSEKAVFPSDKIVAIIFDFLPNGSYTYLYSDEDKEFILEVSRY